MSRLQRSTGQSATRFGPHDGAQGGPALDRRVEALPLDPGPRIAWDQTEDQPVQPFSAAPAHESKLSLDVRGAANV